MAIFVGAIIWITMPLLEQPRFIGSLRIGLGVAGAVFTATGVMLWVWGGRTLVPSTGWGEDNNPKYLVTEGPYKLMRHPVYVGVVSLMVGWILLTGAVYSFLLCPIFYLLLCFEAYLEEERALRPRFENRVVVQLCK
jgi:protein-S-isoprenylcysteine O-methyltransferase Ste14